MNRWKQILIHLMGIFTSFWFHVKGIIRAIYDRPCYCVDCRLNRHRHGIVCRKWEGLK